MNPAGYNKMNPSVVFTVQEDGTITPITTTWYSNNYVLTINGENKFVIKQTYSDNAVAFALTKIG